MRKHQHTIHQWAAALSGIVACTSVWAENPPEHTEVAYKYLHYQDQQPNLKRVGVNAHSLSLSAPVGAKWSVDASAVNDSVSGASPRAYSTVSSASRMKDNRQGSDMKWTYYQERSAYGASVSRSQEHDYVSNAVGMDARWSSDDNNRTLNVGVGYSSDEINSSNGVAVGKTKKTSEYLVGYTMAISEFDLMQWNLSWSLGKGYFSDPYKSNDTRPMERSATVLLGRWNHHFESRGATLRTSYRFYTDNWKVRTHTLGAEWVQPINDQWTVIPSLRYYTQSSAYFYYDPVMTGSLSLPPIVAAGMKQTADSRLSAFGALNPAIKVVLKLPHEITTDMKVEYYRQDAQWRLLGKGSPGLEPFTATSLQWGVSKKF